MSTFLELCQATRLECGIPGSGPTSVTNQTGELARIVGWVRESWTDLQNEQNAWRWMTGNFTIQTADSDPHYAYNDSAVTDADTGVAISRFARWWTENIQIYLTSGGLGSRHMIPYTGWDSYRFTWLTGSQPNGYPACSSIDPQNRLRLGPVPNGIYTLEGEYQKSAQILAEDDDTPEMPARFHRLIVAMAMKRYAAFEAAPEVHAAADMIENGERGRPGLRAALLADQLQEPRFAAPLA